ncbi:hypothetical protein TKK_0013873 [Trichogramma kaykai]
MRQCVETGQSVNGVLNRTILTDLTFFNVVEGFVPDTMHCIDLGPEKYALFVNTIALSIIPKMELYLNHWSHLVKAYYIILSQNIPISQVLEADRLLKKFVILTEDLYSRSAMTFNVHQLLHLTQSVVNWGPLWAHSGYAFENGNGQLVKQVQASCQRSG